MRIAIDFSKNTVFFTCISLVWLFYGMMIMWDDCLDNAGDTTASDEEASAQVFLVDPKKSSVPSSPALLNLIQMSLFGFFKINLIILQCRFRTRH